MAKPSARTRLSRRHEGVAAIVNEWFQTLPYPQNQQPRQHLINDLVLYVDQVVEAAYAVVKEEIHEEAGHG